MHVEFSEQKALVNITVFKTPKDDGKYEVRQKGQKLVIFRNGEQVQEFALYLPAKIIAVHLDDYKISILLHKEEEKRWHTIKGPETATQIQQTNYTEDEPEDKKKNLWQFLEEVYFNGDEETKAAMLKSFKESQGEVLSTNWKSAGSKK